MAVFPFGVSCPQPDTAVLGRALFLMTPGAFPPVLARFQVTVSVDMESTAVSVMAGAPAPSVVVAGGLLKVTLMALIVRLSTPDLLESDCEAAVMVAVQSAFRVAADGGV